MMKRILPLAMATLLGGCASIFSGITQDVSIRTTQGARFAITDDRGNPVGGGESQGNVILKRGAGYFSPHAYQAKLSKPGYLTKTVDIEPGINPWYFANILLGGIVGMVIVDPLTGAMYKFYPDNIDAQLDINPNAREDEAGMPGNNSQAKAYKPTAYSKYEYAAAERAKVQGCKIKDNPAFDGVKTPNETLVFPCRDGNTVTVVCNSTDGCR